MTDPSLDLLTPAVRESLADVLGGPVAVQLLKGKPGRRCTVRATGRSGTAIAKVYASERAPVVAARVASLTAAGGQPTDPLVPSVLRLDVDAHLVVLSDLPGVPLSQAVLAGDLDAVRCAGTALGRWHQQWTGRPPAALRHHTVARELAILEQRAATAPTEIRRAVEGAAVELGAPWPASTAVHRDLYEEQILVGERIGLIDLDDAAAGPPELDVGNLLAHLDLLGRRRARVMGPMVDELLDGYRQTGPELDAGRLAQCHRLSALRLACIHSEPLAVAADRRP